jgi:hypothetical protein
MRRRITWQAFQRPIALLVPPSRRSLTNAVLLMGAYMILKMDFDDAAAIMGRFAELQEWVVPYRDVTPGVGCSGCSKS